MGGGGGGGEMEEGREGEPCTKYPHSCSHDCIRPDSIIHSFFKFFSDIDYQ